MKRTTILIIDHNGDGNLKERLDKHPEFEVIGLTNNLDMGFTLAEKHQPAVILLNIDLSEKDRFATAEVFAFEFPGSGLILMTASDNEQLFRHALQIGAKDVIKLPVEDGYLHNVISNVIQLEGKRREHFSLKKKQRQFKVITVFGTKGGVGKTTVALNLAIAIRQMTGKRVALIDLNLHSGNAALLAGIPYRRSIKDVVDDINNLDEEMLDSYCAVHPSGLKILPAPVLTEYAAFIQPEHVDRILKFMSQIFNYVIVDAPTSFHDTIIPALEHSNEILLLTTIDMASIHCLKQSMVLLGGLSMRSKVRLVVNRVGYNGGLRLQDLEKELGIPALCTIPDCGKAAIDAVNLGKPLLISAKSSPAAERLEELAKKITGDNRFSA